MSKQPTKAALQAQLDALNASFEQAHAMLMQVSAERDALKAELELANEALALGPVPPITPRTQRAAPAMPNWQAERAAAMAEAKALAMRMRCVVRV